MKGNRKIHTSTESSIFSTESPEAIALKYKATFFLAVIHSITKAFELALQGFNTDRYQRFSEQMTRYTNRCQDVQNGSSRITRLWNNASKRARENDVEENKKLDGDIENFYYTIDTFFDGCNAAIQQRILTALETEINEGVDEQDSKNLLEEILKKLRFHKKMGELDNIYIPPADEILNVFTISEIHKGVNLPLSTVAPIKLSKRRSIIDPPSIFNFRNILEKPKELERPKSSIGNDTQVILSDNDIYDFMDIDPNLFSGKECLDEPIRIRFQEIFKLEPTFLKFLGDLLFIELPYIKQMVVKKESQHRFIDDFLQKLKICWQTQVELCARMKHYRDQFSLDSLETINENAMKLFLSIYEVDNLKQQIASFLQLESYWPKVDALLQEHKEAIQQLVQNPEQEIVFQGYKQKMAEQLQEEKDEDKRILPIIAWDFTYSLEARPTQICIRRILPSKEIIKSLKFEEQEVAGQKLEENVQERYKFICYIPARYNLMNVFKEDGYVRPKALLPLLEKYFNKNQRYSLTYFLIHPDANEKLSAFKEAFISFAMRDKENAYKLKFFKEIYDLFQKQPFCLSDLNFLKRYFDISNPLKLDRLQWTNTKEALGATEGNAAVKMKNIITELIPAIEEVSVHLSLVLKDFHQSPDIVDVLLTVPDIREKVGDKNSLAALDKKDIANLPSFWRDIFVSEGWALRRSLTQKKNLWLSYHVDTPESVREMLEPFLDSELSIDYDQFIEKRKCIAQELFGIEVEKQIELLGGKEGIFSNDVLTMLKASIQNKILPELLQKLPEANEPFFLFYYAEAILQIRYILFRILEEYFSAEKVKIEKAGEMIENSAIFSRYFSPKTDGTALDLQSLVTLLKDVQRNRPRFNESEKTMSAFRVFALVKSKSRSDVYANLKRKIKKLSCKPAKLSQKKIYSIGPATPIDHERQEALEKSKPFVNSGLSTLFCTPMAANSQKKEQLSPYRTSLSVVKTTGHIDFKKLASELDTIAQAKQLQLKKYIRSNTGEKEDYTADSEADCNYIKVRKSDKLLLTAQSSNVDGSVTFHCHEDNLVAEIVEAMKNSIQTTKTVVALEININASDAEVPLLINKYVEQALKQKFLPEVIVNSVVLTPAELCEKLNKPLVDEYSKIKDAPEQVIKLRNRAGFFNVMPKVAQPKARQNLLKKLEQIDEKSKISSEVK